MTLKQAKEKATQRSKQGKTTFVLKDCDEYDWTDSKHDLETFFLDCPIVAVFYNGLLDG